MRRSTKERQTVHKKSYEELELELQGTKKTLKERERMLEKARVLIKKLRAGNKKTTTVPRTGKQKAQPALKLAATQAAKKRNIPRSADSVEGLRDAPDPDQTEAGQRLLPGERWAASDAEEPATEDEMQEGGFFKLTLTKGAPFRRLAPTTVTRVRKAKAGTQRKKGTQPVTGKRLAGHYPTKKTQMLDNQARARLSALENNLIKLQDWSMPEVMQDSYSPPEGKPEELVRALEHYWPKVVFGLFCLTQMRGNEDAGKNAKAEGGEEVEVSGNWLRHPRMHMLAGSKAACQALEAGIRSDQTLWNTTNDFRSFENGFRTQSAIKKAAQMAAVKKRKEEEAKKAAAMEEEGPSQNRKKARAKKNALPKKQQK